MDQEPNIFQSIYKNRFSSKNFIGLKIRTIKYEDFYISYSKIV